MSNYYYNYIRQLCYLYHIEHGISVGCGGSLLRAVCSGYLLLVLLHEHLRVSEAVRKGGLRGHVYKESKYNMAACLMQRAYRLGEINLLGTHLNKRRITPSNDATPCDGLLFFLLLASSLHTLLNTLPFDLYQFTSLISFVSIAYSHYVLT